MSLRLLQVLIADAERVDLDDALEGHEVIGTWRDSGDGGRAMLHLLVHAREAEAIMDRLQDAAGGREGFRVVLLPVEATLPRLAAEEPAGQGEPEAPSAGGWRVSREELYTEVTEGLDPDRVFLAMSGLSAAVAAIGLLRDDTAVIIGAMVIAPLLAPNVATALATTLGDRALLVRSLKASAAGMGLALLLAIGIGLVVPVPADVPAILARTRVGYPDLALALAAGAAGTLAFSRGITGAVIGVMVAVALLPPLVTFGLLLGAGKFGPATQALLLTATNLVCVNLAGVGTFLAQGIRPRSWWEEERARKATRVAVGFWGALVLLLAVLMWFARLWGEAP